MSKKTYKYGRPVKKIEVRMKGISIHAEKCLDEFLESGDKQWEVNKEEFGAKTSSITNALRSRITKERKYANIRVIHSGKQDRVFLKLKSE